MIGPGKYDDLCTDVRVKAGAKAALVIIIEGSKGSGFSCQTDLERSLLLPELLEYIADQIRRNGVG